MAGRPTTIFFAGDVMTGRGIDQVLPHPGNPRLREPFVRDARTYVELAERAGGPIPRPVDYRWPWGDALAVLDEVAPEARVINLETGITRGGVPDRDKQVHYRMSPENMPCLATARLDVCALANNHVLDYGHRGLTDTLDTLAAAGIAGAGAGAMAGLAREPAVVPVEAGGRIVVFSLGTVSSGIPWGWAATVDRPGVDLLPDLSRSSAGEVIAQVRRVKQPGDLVVVSLHWGSNWGYDVPSSHVRFARRLIDGGVDVVHGHSSHHPRAIEVYRGRPILYGCGDLIDDYEGIRGHEQYRQDLRALYFVSIRPGAGLARLRIVPMRARGLSLHRAGDDDTERFRGILDRACRPFGSQVGHGVDDELELRAA